MGHTCTQYRDTADVGPDNYDRALGLVEKQSRAIDLGSGRYDCSGHDLPWISDLRIHARVFSVESEADQRRIWLYVFHADWLPWLSRYGRHHHAVGDPVPL